MTRAAGEAPRLRAPSKVLASAATGLPDLIGRMNGDVDAVFGNALLELRDIGDPLNALNLGQYCALFEAAAKDTGHDNFGLVFGAQFQPRQLGMIGYVAIASPTLRAGLGNMLRHFPAHQSHTTFSLVEDRNDPEVLWLCYRVLDERIRRKRQDAELSMGMLRNILRQALGPDWCPHEMLFEHARPDHPADHERLFGAPVRFGQATNAIGLTRKDLGRPMPGQDPYLLSVAESFLQRRCEPDADPEDLTTLIREQIKMRLDGQAPTIPVIAKIMGETEWGFRQTLRKNGLGFPDLVRSARRELAMHYMGDTSRPLTDIAFALGYSELSAFSRAFRSWTGVSPRAYRRRAGNTP